jgi:hypothetical protein
MKHMFASTVALWLGVGAALAESPEQRAMRCAAQGEVLREAVVLRLRFVSERKAKQNITRATAPEMQGAVPLLVGYAYSLTRKELRQGDLAASFEAQCRALDVN